MLGRVLGDKKIRDEYSVQSESDIPSKKELLEALC
jgi:hypothetical protein